MRVITCIKYILEKNISAEPSGNSNFELGTGKLNPADMFAIEEGIRIKERYGAEVTGICMGVPKAVVALKQAIAMGLDRIILMSDQRFAGSDTYATSYVLSRGIAHIGAFDLVICGKQSVDGDTGQVAQEMAAHMGVPCLINVVSFTLAANDMADCVVLTEYGYLEVRLELPAVISVLKGINEPRVPTVAGIAKAQSAEINIISVEDIKIDVGKCGLLGSPTRVKSVRYHVHEQRENVDITDKYIHVIESVLEKVRGFDEDDKSRWQNGHIPNLDKKVNLEKREEVWVLCEVDDGEISLNSRQLVSKAAQIISESQRLCSVVLRSYNVDWMKQLESYGVERIYCFAEEITISDFSESMPNTLYAICKKYKPDIVLFGGTVWGKWIAPLVAAKLGTGLTADCLDLKIEEDTGNLLQIRTAYGGNLIAEIVCPDTRPQMATVRTNAFSDRPACSGYGLIPEVIDISEFICHHSRIMVTGMKCGSNRDSFANNLSNADIVICGGRGVGGKQGFKKLFELSQIIGGAVGATRYAVDAGWIDYSFQIGQTGMIVRPKVYINFGVSGAIEHIVGMQEAGCVISVNQDPAAPIFAYSHYKIVDNCNVVLNKLIQYFSGRGGQDYEFYGNG